MVVYVLTNTLGRESDEVVFRDRETVLDHLEDMMRLAEIDDRLDVVDSFNPMLEKDETIFETACRMIKLIEQADFIYFAGSDALCEIIYQLAEEEEIPLIPHSIRNNSKQIEMLRTIWKGENNNVN